MVIVILHVNVSWFIEQHTCKHASIKILPYKVMLGQRHQQDIWILTSNNITKKLINKTINSKIILIASK